MDHKTILIVEADEVLAAHLERMLAAMDYTPLGPAATGEEAVEAALRLDPDLVLMDIELAGGVDGIAAADRIRAAKDAPVIFMTGHSHKPVQRQPGIAAAYGYLVKPVAEPKLAAAVEFALHRHGLDRQLREREAELRSFMDNIPGSALPDSGHRRIPAGPSQ